jgi:hypothetical protein
VIRLIQPKEQAMIDTEHIHEHMPILGSCGTYVGKVDAVEGASIKVTADSPGAHGHYHYLPLAWVDHVDTHVHLDRPSSEIAETWNAAPIGTTA